MNNKQDLLELIGKTECIPSLFHVVGGGNGIPTFNQVYDVLEFENWRADLQFQLQKLQEKFIEDQFLLDTLNILNDFWEGWRDEQHFRELSSKLTIIKKNIEDYFPEKGLEGIEQKKGEKMSIKPPKIFISHSSKDKRYIKALHELFEDIGLDKTQMFCSSIPEYGIPLDEDIYEYLRSQFDEFNLHVIFVLSKNYYESTACLNEMGAAWILQNSYTTILLPKFKFSEIDGAVNPRKIGLKLDSDKHETKTRLNQLRENLVTEFELPYGNDSKWERHRDEFFDKIKNIMEENNLEVSKREMSDEIRTTQKLSVESIELLKNASQDPNGMILKVKSFSGLTVQTNGLNFVESKAAREEARWESALEELYKYDLVKGNSKNDVFTLTKKGFEAADKI